MSTTDPEKKVNENGVNEQELQADKQQSGEKKETVAAESGSAEAGEPLPGAGKEEAVSEKKGEDPAAKFQEINEKYLRLYSDFDNFRKRTAKEKNDMFKYAGEELITMLLPVLDDFERAIKAGENSEDTKAIKEGVQLIFQKMKNTLTQQGLKEMEISDGEFDSELHDAISKVNAPKKEQVGKIVDVVQKGYFLNDKVIRHAKVVVGS